MAVGQEGGAAWTAVRRAARAGREREGEDFIVVYT